MRAPADRSVGVRRQGAAEPNQQPPSLGATAAAVVPYHSLLDMKSIEATGVTIERVWEAAAWYRALSLAERVAALDGAPARSASPDALGETACRRLETWKTQKPFEQKALFDERLAHDALSEADLLFLLSESAESLKARARGVPDWLLAIREAFTRFGSDARLAPVLDEVEGDHPLQRALLALAPLLQRGIARVEADVRALRRSGAFVPVASGSVPRIFVGEIAATLLFQVSKPLILEMHIARLEGRLEGDTPEGRFDDFLRRLGEEQLIVPLLAKYPVLARQLVTTVDHWAEYLSEFIAHLCADWSAVCATFADGGEPGLLKTLDAGQGDTHRRGRSVLLLRFESGLRLLYKPKPLDVDAHFQELLSWLNARGAEPPLRPLKLLPRSGYGWAEFVAASPCRSEAELARFYERQGAYLAVLYSLGAADVHNENLLAAGEHPMIVDLEALFHPNVYAGDAILGANLAAEALDQSVWQVGLLPRRVWSDEESVGVDMSGLGGDPGQMNPHPIVGWERAGRDEMRLTRRRVELPASKNRPRLGGEEVDALAYQDSILAGFTRMYRLLAQHKEAFLTDRLPRFAGDDIRVVVRSTNVYSLLLYESFHPDLLRDALDRDRFFDRLWGEAAQRPHLAGVIPAERRDLLRADIPFFAASPPSRTIFTSEGEPLVDFLAEPSLDVVRRRVHELGEADLAEQLWIIEASLATLRMGRHQALRKHLQLLPRERAVSTERLLARATALGERLEQLALQNDSGAYWLGVGPLDDSNWGVFPAGVDLYAGAPGIALFLAYLGSVTGEQSHTSLSRRALAPVRAQVRTWLEEEGREQNAAFALPTVGAFDGVASVVYVLLNLGTLWREPELVREAEALVAKLPPLISRDENLDVVYGSAGCILVLLALHAIRPSRNTLDVAVQCGERLLATAQPLERGLAWTTLEGQPPLGGFSHGAAGVALSLLQLAGRSGEERFRAAALEAREYDRSLFIPELNHWRDLRVFPEKRRQRAARSEGQVMVAWCHGAPGIGLARLAGLNDSDDANVRAEIDIALASTIEHGFDMNHSLCHGALGNLELLLTAAEVLGRPQDHEELERAAAVALGSLEANGPVTGVPLGVETPGFMTGLAGIGYELLRVAEPKKVPSALVLAPPSTRPAK
jgi:type 2 lantibiotic biosynthesis protein LanM